MPDEGWSIPVAAVAGAYHVRVGPGLLSELPRLLAELSPAFRYAVIADEHVFDLHGRELQEVLSELDRSAEIHTFPQGEASKSRAEWMRLTDALLERGIGRDGCVLAFGGGVAGDLAGFVAATYMRGIPVVQLPTSLVAMVDASVGGKTGVDVSLGKNLVGSFHAPRFVLADTNLTATLSRQERSQGLAEAVKHGAILDRDYFGCFGVEAEALMDGDAAVTAAMVARSVELKADVVSRDEREGGLRQILNFGHTLGHALEAASEYRLPHGDAVAIGMVLEARLGEKLGITETGTASALTATLRAVGLPTEVDGAVDPEEIESWVSRDKKAREGAARYVLLSGVGQAYEREGWSTPVDPEVVHAFLTDLS